MPTNAERVQRVLAAAEGQSLSFARQLEVALIRSAAGLDSDKCPEIFERECSKHGGYDNRLSASQDPMDQWLHRQHDRGSKKPGFDLPSEDGIPLTHAIFAATDFGRDRIPNLKAVSRVTRALRSETDMELVGEYLICLVAMHSPLAGNAATKLEEFEQFFDASEWGLDLHPYLVGGLLFALKG